MEVMTYRTRRRLATLVLAPAAALTSWALIRLTASAGRRTQRRGAHTPAGLSVTRSGFVTSGPAELDLMAHLEGMELRERWAGWDREPFTGESSAHVSAWTRSVR